MLSSIKRTFFFQAKLLGKHREELAEVAARCKQESGVTPEEYDQFKNGTIPANEKIKNVFVCMSKEYSVLDDNGKLNKTAYMEIIHGRLRDEATEQKFISECIVDEDTPGDTALHIRQCSLKYFKKVP